MKEDVFKEHKGYFTASHEYLRFCEVLSAQKREIKLQTILEKISSYSVNPLCKKYLLYVFVYCFKNIYCKG